MALVLTMVYLVVLVLVWIPLYIVSFGIGEIGVYVALVLLVFGIGRFIVRYITFPGGSSYRVPTEISQEFAKYSIRILDNAANVCIDLSNHLLTSSSRKKSSRFLSDFCTLWERVVQYRDRILEVYRDTFRCLHDCQGQATEIHISTDLTLACTTATEGIQDTEVIHRTEFGNNILKGDIGTTTPISSYTFEERGNLCKLLTKQLSDLTALENLLPKRTTGNKKGQIKGITADAISNDIRNAAQQLIKSSKEVKDALQSLCPSAESTVDEDDNNGSSNSTNSRQSNPNNPRAIIKKAKDFLESMFDRVQPGIGGIFNMDVLRGCVIARYINACQYWVPRSMKNGGGFVDCLHIPPLPSDTPKDGVKRAVLYCNPNAGLYEVSTGMNLVGGNVKLYQHQMPSDDDASSCSDSTHRREETCWADFYLNQGYHVFLFNYSGYGRSYIKFGRLGRIMARFCCLRNELEKSGVSSSNKCWRIFKSMVFDVKPSPDSLKADALTVAEHMTTVLQIDKLVIHGESIGGMAAASTANELCTKANNNNKTCIVPSLLICDRTFCNLEATAQRLVGGWAGPAIRLLTPFWNTDVARDFLNTTCPKVVANDGCDIIIADVSSLRSGVALAREFHSNDTHRVGWICDAPIEHRMSDWENVGVMKSRLFQKTPTIQAAPIWPADKRISINEAFYFAACVKRIGKVATAAKRNAKPAGRRQPSHDQEHDEEEGIEITTLRISSSTTANKDHDCEEFDNGDDDDSVGSICLSLSNTSSPNNSPNDDIFEAWKVLSCCDGLCGLHLGICVKHGHDCVVSWLSSTLTYGCQSVTSVAEQRRMANAATANDGDLEIISHDFDRRSKEYSNSHVEGETEEGVVHPIPIPEVISTLKKLMDRRHLRGKDCGIGTVETEIRYCISMMEYIVDRIASTQVVESSLNALHFRENAQGDDNGGEEDVGFFFKLHCGHNNQFSVDERDYLRLILKKNV